MDLHDERRTGEARDRCDVTNEIEIELVVEGGVTRVRRRGYKERIAIRGRAHDRLGADITSGTRPVVDDERLSKPLRQPLTDQARIDVGSTTRRIANNEAHRPRRIGLRPSKARRGR